VTHESTSEAPEEPEQPPEEPSSAAQNDPSEQPSATGSKRTATIDGIEWEVEVNADGTVTPIAPVSKSSHASGGGQHNHFPHAHQHDNHMHQNREEEVKVEKTREEIEDEENSLSYEDEDLSPEQAKAKKQWEEMVTRGKLRDRLALLNPKHLDSKWSWDNEGKQQLGVPTLIDGEEIHPVEGNSLPYLLVGKLPSWILPAMRGKRCPAKIPGPPLKQPHSPEVRNLHIQVRESFRTLQNEIKQHQERTSQQGVEGSRESTSSSKKKFDPQEHEQRRSRALEEGKVPPPVDIEHHGEDQLHPGEHSPVSSSLIPLFKPKS